MIELLFGGVVIGIIAAIVALPAWLFANAYFIPAIAVIGLYDIIIYKIYDLPAISILIMFALRIFLRLLLITVILTAVLFIAVTYFDFSFEKYILEQELITNIDALFKTLKYYLV